MRRDVITPREKVASAALALRLSARRWWQRFRARVAAVGAFLSSAGFLVVVLLLAGVGMGTAGVHLLFGTGWALVAGSGFSFMLALLIARGTHHG